MIVWIPHSSSKNRKHTVVPWKGEANNFENNSNGKIFSKPDEASGRSSNRPLALTQRALPIVNHSQGHLLLLCQARLPTIQLSSRKENCPTAILTKYSSFVKHNWNPQHSCVDYNEMFTDNQAQPGATVEIKEEPLDDVLFNVRFCCNLRIV